MFYLQQDKLPVASLVNNDTVYVRAGETFSVGFDVYIYPGMVFTDLVFEMRGTSLTNDTTDPSVIATRE